MPVRLLADDLTGALDTAAQFCGAGPMPVLLQRPVRWDGPAALDLGCRDGAEADAVAATLAAAPLLMGADVAYLKIDSLLRGHWAAMLAALLRTGRFPRCILAPAFPAQGRITQGGRQYARGADGGMAPVAIDPAAALAAQGVRLGEAVALRDAATDADLRAIVAQAGGGPALWVGAAGLAAALAGPPPPPVTALPGPLLAVIGSHHPVSHAQVAACDAPVRPAQSAAEIGETLRRHGSCVLRFDIADGTPPDHAARLIADRLATLLPTLPPPGTLVAAGGETLRAACRALGATRLDALGAITPGVPLSRLRGGAWDGVSVVSKSGAFGAPGLLAALVGMGDASAC